MMIAKVLVVIKNNIEVVVFITRGKSDCFWCTIAFNKQDKAEFRNSTKHHKTLLLRKEHNFLIYCRSLLFLNKINLLLIIINYKNDL